MPERILSPEMETQILDSESERVSTVFQEIAQEKGGLSPELIKEFDKLAPTKEQILKKARENPAEFAKQVLATEFGRGGYAPDEPGSEFYESQDRGDLFRLAGSMASKGAEDIVQGLVSGPINLAGAGMQKAAGFGMDLMIPDNILDQEKMKLGFTPETPTAEILKELTKETVRSSEFGRQITNEQGLVDIGKQVGEVRKETVGADIEELIGDVGPLGTATTLPLYLASAFGAAKLPAVGGLFTGEAFEGPIASLIGKGVSPIGKVGAASGTVGAANVIANTPFAIEEARDPATGDVNVGSVVLSNFVAGLIGAVAGGAVSFSQIYKEAPGKFGGVLDSIIGFSKKENAQVDGNLAANRQQLNQMIEANAQVEAAQHQAQLKQQINAEEQALQDKAEKEVSAKVIDDGTTEDPIPGSTEAEKAIDEAEKSVQIKDEQTGDKISVLDKIGISTREATNKISKKKVLSRKLTNFEAERRTLPVKFKDKAINFMRDKKNLFTNKDQELWDLAKANSDTKAQNELLEKYSKKPGGENLKQFHEDYTKAKDEIFNLYKEKTGHDVGALEGHWPRYMKNYNKYLKDQGKEAKTAFMKEVDRFEKKNGRAPTELEKKEMAGRIFAPGKIKRAGGAKKRTKNQISLEEMKKYYASSDEAFSHYVDQFSEEIAETNFLGKSRPPASFIKDDDVNAYVKDLAEKKKRTISKEDARAILERQLEKQPKDKYELFVEDLIRRGDIDPTNKKDAYEIVEGVLKRSKQDVATMKSWKDIKDPDKLLGSTFKAIKSSATYSLLTNVLSGMVQLEDLAVTASRHGALNTIKGVITTMARKSKVPLKRLGLRNISAEFSTLAGRKSYGDALMNAGLFKPIDLLTKQATFNAAFDNYQNLAQKVNPASLKRYKKTGNVEDLLKGHRSQKVKKFLREQEELYGPEIEGLVNDFKQGNADSDFVVKSILEDLGHLQPIRDIDLPLFYLRHPYGRVLYTLKSFTIKRLELWRNHLVDNFAKSKTLGDKAEATKDLAKFMLYVTGGGVATRTAIKEASGEHHGEDYTFLEIAADTLLSQFLLSRYALGKLGEGDISGTIARFMPPVNVLSDALVDTNDIFTGDFDISRAKSIRNIPVGGRIYDARAGRSAQKREKEAAEGLGLSINSGLNLDLGI